MGKVVITPIYSAGWSNVRVEASHIHPENDHVPMRESEDRGKQIPPATDPTRFRYTIHECPRCDVRVTTSLLHQVRLTELKGLVIEHEDGGIDKYGDVPDDWRTSERQATFT